MKRSWVVFCIGVLVGALLLASGLWLMHLTDNASPQNKPTLKVTYNGKTLSVGNWYCGPEYMIPPQAYPQSYHTLKANSVLTFTYSTTPDRVDLYGDESLTEQKIQNNKSFTLTIPSEPGEYGMEVDAQWGFDDEEASELSCSMRFWVFADLPECPPSIGLKKPPMLSMTYNGRPQDIEYTFIGPEDMFALDKENYRYQLSNFYVKANSDLIFSFSVAPMQVMIQESGFDSFVAPIAIYAETDQIALTAPSTLGKHEYVLVMCWSDSETGYCRIWLDVEA